MNNQSTMVSRLANVIYWAGCIIAPIAAVHGFGETIEFFTRADAPIEGGLAFFAALCYGIPVYLVGLAARYVLTGQGIRRQKP